MDDLKTDVVFMLKTSKTDIVFKYKSTEEFAKTEEERELFKNAFSSVINGNNDKFRDITGNKVFESPLYDPEYLQDNNMYFDRLTNQGYSKALLSAMPHLRTEYIALYADHVAQNTAHEIQEDSVRLTRETLEQVQGDLTPTSWGNLAYLSLYHKSKKIRKIASESLHTLRVFACSFYKDPISGSEETE